MEYWGGVESTKEQPLTPYFVRGCPSGYGVYTIFLFLPVGHGAL